MCHRLHNKQGSQRWQIPRPAKCQCLTTFHPIKIARVFILLIDTATQEVPMKNIWKKLSVQFFEIRHWMLNVAHVTNYVKWRPIVTTFGTLIENMSRTGLYDCHFFQIFLDDFMSNINWGIGVLHVKRQISRYFATDNYVANFAGTYNVLRRRPITRWAHGSRVTIVRLAYDTRASQNLQYIFYKWTLLRLTPPPPLL